MQHAWTDDAARWIFRRSATLRMRGAKAVSGMVLPTFEFYPAKLEPTGESVKAFFARTIELAGLDFLDVDVEIVSGDDASSGGCGTSGCSSPGLGLANGPALGGRVRKNDDGSYVARIAESEIAHPTVLATLMAKAAAAIFLTELDGLDGFAKTEREGAIELTAILLGFGPILMNGSAIVVRGCGGAKVHAATTLSAGEVALGLAIACTLDRTSMAAVGKHLGEAALEVFKDAQPFVEANADVVARIDTSPESVDGDHFSLREPGGFFARVFGRKKRDPFADLERELADKKHAKPIDAAKAARLRELRALVDETLRS